MFLTVITIKQIILIFDELTQRQVPMAGGMVTFQIG